MTTVRSVAFASLCLLAAAAILVPAARAQRNTKKLALVCLIQAAQHSPEHAEPIARVLEDTLHFSGRHAVDERIMVGYVRLRRLAAEHGAASQTA